MKMESKQRKVTFCFTISNCPFSQQSIDTFTTGRLLFHNHITALLSAIQRSILIESPSSKNSFLLAHIKWNVYQWPWQWILVSWTERRLWRDVMELGKSWTQLGKMHSGVLTFHTQDFLHQGCCFPIAGLQHKLGDSAPKASRLACLLTLDIWQRSLKNFTEYFA